MLVTGPPVALPCAGGLGGVGDGSPSAVNNGGVTVQPGSSHSLVSSHNGRAH